MKYPTLPKVKLLRIMQRFLADKERGISRQLFAQLAGMSKEHLEDVFLHQTEPLTERVQYRTSKAYHEWVNGEVAIMQNRDRTKFVDYRKEPKPALKRAMNLHIKDGKIAISLGIKPKYDYDVQTLDEQLERG